MRALLILFLLPIGFLQGLVYDCFLFFNEIELVEAKLKELDPVVDRFVIVECVETFKGQEKPLYFLRNKGRLSSFKDKIIHVVVKDRKKGGTPWEREWFQRDQIMRGLQQCQDSDVIIIEDADEIVRKEWIPQAALLLKEYPTALLAAQQRLHRFFLNTYYSSPAEAFPPQWTGSVITTFGALKQSSPQQVRDKKDSGAYLMQNGGWHFTSLGGEEKISYKEKSYSHDDNYLWQGVVKKFSDLADHPDWFRVDTQLADYPTVILENIDYFKNIGFIY